MTIRNWIGIFLIGTVNNLPYVIVNSAASTIADSFNEKNLVGAVFGANVVLSVFVKSLNTFLLLNVSYRLRFIVNGCVMLAGLFGIAYAFNFAFAIACIAVVGATAAFGENVTLGFLLWFPSSTVNAWSSGTGMAGLLGSSLYIIFGCVVGNGQGKTSHLHNLTKYAFLLSTPIVLVYWMAFFVLIKRPTTRDVLQVNTSEPHLPNYSSNEDVNPVSGSAESYSGHEDVNATSSDIQDENLVSEVAQLIPKESATKKFTRCFMLVIWLALNLCLVYMFEYVAQACADKVRLSREYNIGCPELYASLQLCYQAGVFVSRSSVQLFKIRRVEILTFCQLINMFLWILDAHYKFLPVACLPALMVFVGLLGGASYVNIFYLILNDSAYPDKDRELCVNITGIFVTLGIILGSALETVLSITALKDD